MSNTVIIIWLITILVCFILSIVFVVYQFIRYCIAYRRYMKKREEKRQQKWSATQSMRRKVVPHVIHKQHTDPDQSERLIKAGLDIGTADMHYRDGVYHQGKPDMITMAVVVPIWSAYALRKLMPTYISKGLNVNGTNTNISYRIGWEPTKRGFVVFYVDARWLSFTLVEFECEGLNDGYIDMMCWLLDNGYVEKKGGESWKS